VLLSGVLMFEHSAGSARGRHRSRHGGDHRRQGRHYDFARQMEGATEVKCSEFASAIVDHL